MEKDHNIDQIRDYWDLAAADFDEHHQDEDKEKWFWYFQRLLGEPAGQTLLDVGTGTGFLAQMAAKAGFQSIGIDFSEEMLSQARKKAEQSGLAVTYLKADLNSLPFADASFDYVVNSRVLWTLTDPDQALRDWYRVLKPGGEVISFVRLTDEMKIFTTQDFYSHEIFEKLPFSLESKDNLMESCRKNGFSKVDLVCLPGITDDIEVFGQWYALRAVKERFVQEDAIHAITSYWDRRVDTYEEQHELTNLEQWKVYLKRFLGEDRKQNIIDLATGTGMIANLLGEMGYQKVTGMDISAGMMKAARKHAMERNTGVTFTYGNALELPLEDASVDVLLNCRLLWTLVEPQKALQEWKRVLKPGGRLLSLQEMSDEYQDEDWKHFMYGKNADPYMELNQATKTDYRKLFEEQGLKDVELIHLEGCTSRENDSQNWYALLGKKGEEN